MIDKDELNFLWLIDSFARRVFFCAVIEHIYLGSDK